VVLLEDVLYETVVLAEVETTVLGGYYASGVLTAML